MRGSNFYAPKQKSDSQRQFERTVKSTIHKCNLKRRLRANRGSASGAHRGRENNLEFYGEAAAVSALPLIYGRSRLRHLHYVNKHHNHLLSPSTRTQTQVGKVSRYDPPTNNCFKLRIDQLLKFK